MPHNQGPGNDDWEMFHDRFEELVEKYDRLLRYVVLRYGAYLLRYADLEEIIDETWCRLLLRRRSGDYDVSIPFAAWLIGICRNVLKDKDLRPSGKSLDGSNGEPVAPDDPPDKVLEDWERLEALRECLSQRSQREQRLYELIFVEDLSKAAAARALGCSEAHVRQNLLPDLLVALRSCMARKGFR